MQIVLKTPWLIPWLSMTGGHPAFTPCFVPSMENGHISSDHHPLYKPCAILGLTHSTLNKNFARQIEDDPPLDFGIINTMGDNCEQWASYSIYNSQPRWWQYGRIQFTTVVVWCKVEQETVLVGWLRGTVGRTSVFDRRTFPVLPSTYSWRVTTYVVNRLL